MEANDLRDALLELGLQQAELATLLDVTPRAISLWLGAERAIPGPTAAYLNLLRGLPLGQRQAEFARLRKSARVLRDGMYRFEYTAPNGHGGAAMLVFERGRVFGTDAGKGRYDGRYVSNFESGLVELELRIEMQAGENSAVGPAQPFAWILDVKTTLDPSVEKGALSVTTNIGPPIEVRYEFMRPLPKD